MLRHSQLHSARRHLLAVCLLLAACALTASHFPAESLPELHVGDKKLHVSGFFVLGTALMLTVAAYVTDRSRRIPLFISIAAMYGLIDELTQPWFNRSADIYDLGTDMVGAMAAMILWEILIALAQRRPAGK